MDAISFVALFAGGFIVSYVAEMDEGSNAYANQDGSVPGWSRAWI
jgi:hypothetical protein